jgi:hypothetical protein
MVQLLHRKGVLAVDFASGLLSLRNQLRLIAVGSVSPSTAAVAPFPFSGVCMYAPCATERRACGLSLRWLVSGVWFCCEVLKLREFAIQYCSIID